jgi:transposase InsO family protein
MNERTNQNLSEEMAVFRFSLIAPVIQGTFCEPSASAYFRRVTAKPLNRPDGIQFHYDPKTLEKWAELYRKGGMKALMPKERCDKGTPRVLTDEAKTEIGHLVETFPRLGGVQVRLRLLEQGLITSDVSERTIQRFLKTNRPLLTSGDSWLLLKDRKAFEAHAFGVIWQADTCHFPSIKENGVKRRTYLMCIVDDHSRLIVGARAFYEDNALNFQILLKTAIAAYGIPQKLYTDHGGPYENGQLAYILGSIGCVLLHAPVRDGAAKAKVERTFGTIKTRFLAGINISKFSSLDEFNTALTDYVRTHNTTHNSGIGMSPLNRYLGSKKCVKIPESFEWLDECFMNRETRKVKNDATVRLHKISLDCPMQFIGQTVEIRFLPNRLEDAYIYQGGKHFPLKKTNKEENARTKRQIVDYSRFTGDDHV